MSHIFAFITCTRVKCEATMEELSKVTGRSVEDIRAEWSDDPDYNSEADTVRLEDVIEGHGWVDRSWSRTALHESRNDVRPAVDSDESDRGTLASETADILGWLEGGFEDNHDGTFYASDSYSPFDEPWDYSYAVHFVRKFLGPDGWTEQPWHPVKDGGLPGDSQGRPDIPAIQALAEREGWIAYYLDKARGLYLAVRRQDITFPNDQHPDYAEINGIDADAWIRANARYGDC